MMRGQEFSPKMNTENKRKIELPDGIKASIAYFIASLISSGISYLTTPIFTRILTPSEYGQVSVYQTWLVILGILAMFNYSGGVFNNGMIDYPDKRDRFTFSILVLSNITTVIFSLILFLIYPITKSYLNLPASLMAVMIIVYLTQPAYNFWMARQRYEYRYKASTIVAILIALLAPLSAIVLLKIFDTDHVVWRVVGFTIPQVFIYLILYLKIGFKVNWKVDTKFWRECFFFNLPLIPHYLSTYVLNSSDKIMISHLVGDSEAAYYSIAYSVAAIATMIWTAINGSLIPYTYQKCKEEKFQDISKVTIPLLTIFAAGCFFVILIAPEVVSFLATDDYSNAIFVIPPIAGGVFFQVQYYIYANILFYYKKPKLVMIASITATLLNLGLNYYFINKYGYIAAGYTTLVCYLIQAVIDYFAMKKTLGRSVYDMKLITILSIIVIIVSLTAGYLYHYIYIRFILILVEVVVMCCLGKPMIKLVRTLKN